MQTVKSFFARHRRLFLTLIVALCAALAAAWAGFDLSQRVDNQPVYEIVNDDYTRTVTIPRAESPSDPDTGLYQPLPLHAGQRIYGVRLNLSTGNWAFRTGTLYGELLDDSGTAVAGGTIDCITIRDNTFADLIFDEPYTAPGQGSDEENYDLSHPTAALRLWYTAEDEEDRTQTLSVWASEDERYSLTAVDVSGKKETLPGAAAFQYVIDYSGSWSGKLSAIWGILTVAAVVLGFVLLSHGAKLWQTVLVCGALLGTAFSVLTPPLVAPDEYTHLARAYQQSSALLGEPLADENWNLLVRECDAPYFGNRTGDIGIFAYKQMLEHLSDRGCDSAVTVSSEVPLTADTINNTLYLGQIAGITLARRLGLGFHAMLLMGRLCNLVFYLVLAALAVALAPQHLKGIFACMALLAQPLQLAGSLSADAAVLGYLFCFTALCFALRNRPARKAEAAGLVVLAALIGPAKAIYLPAVALILLIPNEHLSASRRNAVFTKILAFALALAGWVWMNLSAALYAARDVDTVGLIRAGTALALAAALLGVLYWKIHRDTKKKKIFFGFLAAAAAAAVPVALYKLTHMWGGLTPEQLVGSIQENGDSIYTFSAGYICRNLPNTIKLILRSVSAQGAQWLQGILGTALGEPIVYPIQVSWMLGVGFVLVLLAAALPKAGTALPLGRRTKALCWTVVACVIGLSFFTALNWTPINYTTIFGLQGRYWLPILPLVLTLIHHNRTFAVQKNAEKGTVFAMLCLTSLVILQGGGLYAAWQML